MPVLESGAWKSGAALAVRCCTGLREDTGLRNKFGTVFLCRLVSGATLLNPLGYKIWL
jgi:hypothetical protein